MCRADYPKRTEIIRARHNLLSALKKERDTFEGFKELESAISHIINNTKCDYLAFSIEEPNKVSYAAKCHRHDDVRRTKTSFGRYLRRTFNLTVNDDLLTIFVNNVVRHNCHDSMFSLISGQAIVDAYRNSVGGSSCMTGYDGPVGIYGANDNVQMLIYRGATTTARALVWTCDDGTIVMDRIYPSNGDIHISIMQEYARRQGWVYRLGYNCGNNELSVDKEYSVTLDSSDGQWPYMDTFCYADGDEYHAVLSNQSGDIVLHSTDGSFYNDMTRCDCCGQRVHDDNITYINDCPYCGSCVDSCYTWSDIQEEYVDNDSLVYLANGEVVSDWYAEHNCPRCEHCGEYHYDTENMQEHDGFSYCDSCFDELFEKCSECDEYFAIDDLKDGLCCDCLETRTEKENEEQFA